MVIEKMRRSTLQYGQTWRWGSLLQLLLAGRLSILALLLIVCTAQQDPQTPSQRRLNFALHAQSRYDAHGWVAGSEITTAGLLSALRRHADVQRAEVFAPFAYQGLLTSGVSWDVLLIEGWTGPVPTVISTVRKSFPGIVVLYWCLDTYPSLEIVTRLDVDGFITNSRHLVTSLGRLAPTLYLPLAADPRVMAPAGLSDALRPEYAHPVVYLGQASHSKHRLLDVLTEVAPFGLAIYGHGWDRIASDDDPRYRQLLPHWRGVLPKDDIAALYSSASVVVGTTEIQQRELGMVNNRLFEVLACGSAAFVSDHFPALELLFGNNGTVFYASEAGDAAAHVARLLRNATLREGAAAAGRARILRGHTYDHRVARLVPWLRDTFRARRASFEPRPAHFFHGQADERTSAAPLLRPNPPRVVLVYDSACPPFAKSLASGFDLFFTFGILPALSGLEAGRRFKLTVWPIDMTRADGPESLKSLMMSFDLVLCRAAWDSNLRRVLSRLARENPPYVPLDSRGDQWKKRSALGIFLTSQSSCDEGSAAIEPSSLRDFDVVIHDVPSLRCSIETPANSDAHLTESELRGVADEAGCAHPNLLHGLGIDLRALRDDSEGWHDADLDNGVNGDAATTESREDWKHVAIGGLGRVNGPRAMARLCDPLLLNTSRMMIVPPLLKQFADSEEERAESEARTIATKLRECGVEILELSRPERLARLLQPVPGSRTFKQIEVLDSSECPGLGEITLLAGLASGSQVHVESDNAHLLERLYVEVDAIRVHGRPPLEIHDVSALKHSVHESNAQTFGQKLARALDTALSGIRASAAVDIVNLQDGGTIDRQACQAIMNEGSFASLRVEISLTAFRLPDDGMWCVQINGKEIKCVGDKMLGVDVEIPHDVCFDGKDAHTATTMRIEAVLKSGLDPPVIVRRSKAIELRAN